MTELEWLKQESGLTDDELKAYETIFGDAKFKTMLTKVMAAKDQGTTSLAEAEKARLDLEKQWTDVYQPEMRTLTQDVLQARSEAASARASLEAARQYGIVPPETTTTTATTTRAPGSPDPATMNYVSKDDIARIRDDSGRGIAVINDIGAEHFKLFGSPLPNSVELLDEVTRQRTLGHKDANLRTVWEQKHNVAAKREEIKAAEQKKHDDEVSKNAVKAYAEKHGQNPNTRIAATSRFSTYDPSNKEAGSQPWKRAPGMTRRGNSPWREKSAAKIESSVASVRP